MWREEEEEDDERDLDHRNERRRAKEGAKDLRKERGDVCESSFGLRGEEKRTGRRGGVGYEPSLL